MLLETIIGIATVYGLYFYIQGCQELTIEVRRSWPPQDIEDYNLAKEQERTFGLIILCLVMTYFMFIVI